MTAYKRELKLEHNELPAIYNVETGAMEIQTPYDENIPHSKIIFEPSAQFKKNYSNAWKYLTEVLNNEEFKAAYLMALLAKANTNSLEPLNQDSTKLQISQTLKINKNNTSKVLDTLFKHGVYGSFNVYNDPVTYKNYWLLNPYLAFSGKYIEKGIVELFKNTTIAKLNK